MPDLSPDLKHFLKLAHDLSWGKACEPINVAASEIGFAVLDNAEFLDESALRGLCEFIGRAKYAPQATRELLED